MMNLKVEKVGSIFSKLETLEMINVSKLEKLIKSDLLQTEKYRFYDRPDLEFENEKAYLELVRSKVRNGKLKVSYDLTNTKYGRVYPLKNISICGMRRAVRHTLCSDYYVDLDIDNAHPVILAHLCELNGFEYGFLKEYITNRKEIIKEVMINYKVSRDKAKQLFIILLYFGSFNTWSNDNNLINVEPTDFIIAFSKQLQKIGTNLYNTNKHIEDIIKKKNPEKDFLMSSVVSLVLQEHERRLLEIIYLFLKDIKGFDMKDCVLCFDGIMIKKEYFNNDLLNELSDYIFSKIGIKLNLSKKDMDEDMTDKLVETFTIDETKLDNFDHDYFKSLTNYDNKKIYFEKFVCKVLKPQTLYIFISKETQMEKDLCLYSEKGIRECFREINSGKYNDKGKETKFVDEWLNDENIIRYECIDFLPFSEKNKELINNKVFNTFTGFNNKIDYNYSIMDEKREKVLKPFNDLGAEICEGSIDNWNYFKHFLAHMIQKPAERLPIAFILKGAQGTGKSLLVDTIGELLGRKHYITSSKPEDFFGTFAEGFLNKLLVNMNECEGKDTIDYEGRLKSFITESSITINQKGIRPFQVNNYARLIITTNKQNPIKIDITSKDRRYIVFQSTNKFIDILKGETYFKIKNHFTSPIFLNYLYNELINMNIEEFNFSNRPITESYKEMVRLYVPVEALHLEEFIVDYKEKNPELYNTYQIHNGQDLFKDFQFYCKQNNFIQSGEMSLKKFYSNISSLNIPNMISVKPNNKTSYKFNCYEVYSHLIKRGWVDKPDDYIEEIEIVEKCIEYDYLNEL